jgi:hypothetical protein
MLRSASKNQARCVMSVASSIVLQHHNYGWKTPPFSIPRVNISIGIDCLEKQHFDELNILKQLYRRLMQAGDLSKLYMSIACAYTSLIVRFCRESSEETLPLLPSHLFSSSKIFSMESYVPKRSRLHNLQVPPTPIFQINCR